MEIRRTVIVRDFAVEKMLVSRVLFCLCGLHFGDGVALRGRVEGGSPAIEHGFWELVIWTGLR